MRTGIKSIRAGLPALFCFLLLFAGVSSRAQILTRQQLEEQLRETPEKLYGYFYNYPESGFRQTSAPRGYKPFYISHYGRHGARRTHQEALYTSVLSELDKASESNYLTEYGKLVRERIASAYDEARGLFGELTPLGVLQHKGIARRMVENYPQIFRRKGVEVNAVSSNVRRCIMSMAASTSQLLVMNPGMNLSLSTGDRFMDYIAYDSEQWKTLNADSSPWHASLRDFERNSIHPERLLLSLFTEPEIVDHPIDFAISLRWIVTNLNALDLGFTLDNVFTPDELQAIWETVNYKFYTLYGPNPENGGIPRKDACRLLEDILSGAEAHITAHKTGADLRYGHDVYIMKLMNLLFSGDTLRHTRNPYEAALYWQDFNVTPMAANVQFVFYKNKKNDCLVKVLLNENELMLPLDSDTPPYYHWHDFKTYCQQLITRASRAVQDSF